MVGDGGGDGVREDKGGRRWRRWRASGTPTECRVVEFQSDGGSGGVVYARGGEREGR